VICCDAKARSVSLNFIELGFGFTYARLLACSQGDPSRDSKSVFLSA